MTSFVKDLKLKNLTCPVGQLLHAERRVQLPSGTKTVESSTSSCCNLCWNVLAGPPSALYSVDKERLAADVTLAVRKTYVQNTNMYTGSGWTVSGPWCVYRFSTGCGYAQWASGPGPKLREHPTIPEDPRPHTLETFSLGTVQFLRLPISKRSNSKVLDRKRTSTGNKTCTFKGNKYQTLYMARWSAAASLCGRGR